MLVWEVMVYLGWMSEGMEHVTSFPKKGLTHRTAISEFAGKHAIIPLKDKLPCLHQLASSEIKANID